MSVSIACVSVSIACMYDLQVVHEVIRGVYSFLAKSPKRTRGTRAMAEHYGIKLAQLHYIFEVRMVESEAVAIKNFLIDLPVLVPWMQQNVSEAEGAGQIELEHIKQRGWIRQIRQFKFVTHLLLMLSQDEQMRIFSKQTQSDSAYALEVPGFKQDFRAALEKLNTGALGPEISEHLPELKEGMFGGVKLLGVPGDVDDDAIPEGELIVKYVHDKRPRGSGFQYLLEWENWPDTKDFTWEARSSLKHCQQLVDEYEARAKAKAEGRPLPTLRPTERHTDRVQPARAAAPQDEDENNSSDDVETRIKKYQTAMISVLLAGLNDRVVIPEVVFKFKQCFDYRCMPKCGDAGFSTWGDEALKWIVREKLPHLDVNVVLAQSLHVRVFILENWDR